MRNLRSIVLAVLPLVFVFGTYREAPAQSRSRIPSDSRIAADVVEALGNKPNIELAAVTPKGTSSVLRGELGTLEKTGTEVTASDLAPVLAEIAPAFRLNVQDLDIERITVDDLGSAHVRYRQTKNGLDVVGSSLSVHVDSSGVVYAAFGNARNGEDLPAVPRVSREKAQALALAGRADTVRTQSARLVYVLTTKDQTMHLAWEVLVTGYEGSAPVDEFVFIDAVNAVIVDRHPQIFEALDREVYLNGWGFPDQDPNNDNIPGDLERDENDGPSEHQYVNDNFDLLGDAYDYFYAAHSRDSYDDSGSALMSSVNFLTGPGGSVVQNAAWFAFDKVMVFGVGDPTDPNASRLGSDSDVVTHEMTHGVTQFTSGLIGQNESGALSEAFSDIMAAAQSWWKDGQPSQVAPETWLYGEQAHTPGQTGDARRYMNDPTEDGISTDFYPERLGGNNVHQDNGIVNLAFYLASEGGKHPRWQEPEILDTIVPAITINKAHRIFYRAFTIYLGPGSQMIDARIATVQAADDLYGSTEASAIALAWDVVGVPFLDENAHPINFSTRANVGTGSEIMIMGFWLGGGTSAKPLLLRGVGPTLANLGVTGVMADPIMSLFSGPNQIAGNDDWSSSPDKVAIAQTAAAVYAFALPDPSQDAAIVRSLNPGGYTLQISGDGGGTGNALAELYDADTSNPNHLVNISTRCRVTSSDPMIAGFVISGQAHKRLLVRAVGPTLANFGLSGAHDDPRLKIYQGSNLILENDDWGNDPGVEAAAQDVYAFALPQNSKDAAMLVALPPGIYTAIAESADGTSGICLVEVYELSGILN